MPEWLDTETNEGGVFDGSGNFTDPQHHLHEPHDGMEDDSTSNIGSKQSEMSQTELSQSETQSPAPDVKDSPRQSIEPPAKPNEMESLDHPPVDNRDPVLKAHPEETTGEVYSPAQPIQQQPPPMPQQHQQQPHVHQAPMQRMDPMLGPMHQMSQPPPPVVPQQPWFDSMTMDWFYKDPNGQIQGPFSSRDMGEWSDLGYFKDDLLIRRSVDQQFLPLGQVQLRYQNNPFRSVRHPPALMNPPQPVTPVAINRQPPGMPPQAFVATQPPPQPVQPAPRLSPIEEVVHLIQTSVQHQNVFKQLMIQITQLEQYKVTIISYR